MAIAPSFGTLFARSLSSTLQLPPSITSEETLNWNENDPLTKRSWRTNIELTALKGIPYYAVAITFYKTGRECEFGVQIYDAAALHRLLKKNMDSIDPVSKKIIAITNHFALKLFKVNTNGERVNLDFEKQPFVSLDRLCIPAVEDVSFRDRFPMTSDYRQFRESFLTALDYGIDGHLSEGEAKEEAASKEKISPLGKSPYLQHCISHGTRYCRGLSQENELERLTWFLHAADSGIAEAEYVLGHSFLKGFGFEKNADRAFKYLKRSADKKFIKAYTDLGYCYKEGVGCKKKEAKAFHYYKLGAREKYLPAIFTLGYYYSKGIGCERNLPKAFECYLKAAESGVEHAQSNVAQFYQKGLGCKKDLRLAFYWYEQSAKQGSPHSQCAVGESYLNGTLGPKDPAKALEYFRLAANQKYPDGLYQLGTFYLQGELIEKNPRLAFENFYLASEQGHLFAISSLGFCYGTGFGCEVDHSRAFFLCNKAAIEGNNTAQFNLSLLYRRGLGCVENPRLSFTWMERAATSGEGEHLYCLSRHYAEGYGCEKKLFKAIELLQLAEKRGYLRATEMISALRMHLFMLSCHSTGLFSA